MVDSVSGAGEIISVTYDTWRLRRASMIRLASATISSSRLFSKLEGLSGKGRFEPGEKIDALQPLPTRPISIRYPLYSIGITLKGCCGRQVLAGNAPGVGVVPEADRMPAPPETVNVPLVLLA